jgi:hypothetical protein
MILTFRPAHVDTISSTLTQLEGENCAREPFRADPSAEMLGVGPTFKNQFARRVEHALDCEDTISRFGCQVYCCTHLLSPFLNVFGITPP